MSQPVPLYRRRLAILAPVALAALGAPAIALRLGPDPSRYKAFKARFLTPEGRIVDNGNDGISHSEGQGWALLFAEAHDDREAFDAILRWTDAKLRRPHDPLYAWRWKPGPAPNVEDSNNATDGDIAIAWAMLRAGRRWRRQDLSERSVAIAAALRRHVAKSVPSPPGRDGLVLLPARFGFERRRATVLNPSYHHPAALAAFSAADSAPAWDRLQRDGLAAVRASRFGEYRLPADWVEISHEEGVDPVPAPGWQPRFGFDALRVPLNFVWGGLVREQTVEDVARFWVDEVSARAVVPAWIDLRSGVRSAYAASPGVIAVARLVVTAVAGRTAARGLGRMGEGADGSYYSAALGLLSSIVAAESSVPVG